MCWCFLFHLSCGELSPGRVILPCSRPVLGSALWKGGGSSSTSPANWWHYSLSGNGRLKASASRGLIAGAVLQLFWLVPRPLLQQVLRTPFVESDTEWVLPWRSLWSWWTTAWGASVPPPLLTSRIVHFHPPAHLLALSGRRDPSSPQPWNTNTKTSSELNQIPVSTENLLLLSCLTFFVSFQIRQGEYF